MDKYHIFLSYSFIFIFLFFSVFWNRTAGETLDSKVVVLNIPLAPTNLSATAAAPTEINLSWTDNSDNEEGFKVERKSGAEGSYSLIATTAGNVASYSDSNLSASTVYFYRVLAFNSEGESSYSNEASATTPAAGVTISPIIGVGGRGEMPWLPPRPPPPPEIVKKCDFNRDNRCNLIDLSIMLFYWEQAGGRIARYDLNNNGIVDFPDVSVLMYYWTD
jgi:hypothetical protein